MRLWLMKMPIQKLQTLLRKVDVGVEKEENIWRMTIFGPRRRKRTELAKGESFGEGKLMVTPSWRR